MVAEAFQSAAVPLDPYTVTLAIGEATRMEVEELEELPPHPTRPVLGEFRYSRSLKAQATRHVSGLHELDESQLEPPYQGEGSYFLEAPTLARQDDFARRPE